MPDEQKRFGKFGTKKRQAYLDALREGRHRATAAREIGVSRELVRLYRNATPGWELEEEAAEMEACGKIEDALFTAASGGNVVACQVWLYNRAPDRWKDQRNVKLTGLDDVLNRFPPDFAREVRRSLATLAASGGSSQPPSGSPEPGTNGVHSGPPAG